MIAGLATWLVAIGLTSTVAGLLVVALARSVVLAVAIAVALVVIGLGNLGR